MRRKSSSPFRLIPVSAAVAALLGPLPAWPVVVNWNGGSGFWDVGPWLPGAPATGDDVLIAVAGTNTVTYRTGTLS
jgi:hypothetical protein